MKVLLVDDTVVIPMVTSIINLFFNHRRVHAQNATDLAAAWILIPFIMLVAALVKWFLTSAIVKKT